jgi:hypothetical protein
LRAVGELVRLKERIYLDDKGKALPSPPDADDWRQCWTCGLTVPTRDIKLSGKISGIQGIEPIENKYDYGKSTILGNDARLNSRIKNLKRRQTKHPDSEVQAHIDQGYEVISYQNDEPTSLSSTSYFSQ